MLSVAPHAGKAHKKYESGVKVGIITTEKESIVIMKTFPGNPCDAHTLLQNMENAEKVTGRKLDGDALVDRGYRGRNYEGPATVHIVGKRKRETRGFGCGSADGRL